MKSSKLTHLIASALVSLTVTGCQRNTSKGIEELGIGMSVRNFKYAGMSDKETFSIIVPWTYGFEQYYYPANTNTIISVGMERPTKRRAYQVIDVTPNKLKLKRVK